MGTIIVVTENNFEHLRSEGLIQDVVRSWG
jgi:hypothetical protein